MGIQPNTGNLKKVLLLWAARALILKRMYICVIILFVLLRINLVQGNWYCSSERIISGARSIKLEDGDWKYLRLSLVKSNKNNFCEIMSVLRVSWYQVLPSYLILWQLFYTKVVKKFLQMQNIIKISQTPTHVIQVVLCLLRHPKIVFGSKNK